jgi:hypothetical protein
MANDPKSKKDDFESVARRLGCDEDKARFEKKLGKIARGSTAKHIADRPPSKPTK